MNFEEALADLINQHIEREGVGGIVGAMELQIAALNEEEKHRDRHHD